MDEAVIRAGLDGRDGKKIVLLGLTDENVQHMADGRACQVDLEPFGLQGEILLFRGTTENAMMDQMLAAGLLGPETEVSIDHRLIPDRPPGKVEDVVDTIILEIPEDLVPNETNAHEVGPKVQGWMRERAVSAIKGQNVPGVERIEITQLTWTISGDPSHIERLPAPHDCEKCREGMRRAAGLLREHPGRCVAVGRAEYRAYFAPT